MSILPQWIDSLRSEWDLLGRSAEKTWQAAVANPAKADPKRLKQAMTVLGKTPDDLENAIASVEQRRSWLAEIDKIPALQRRADSLLHKQAKLRADLEEHVVKVEAEIAEARQEEYASIRELQAARSAEAKLREGRPFPQLAELRAKIASASPEIGTLKSAIATADQALGEIRKAMKTPAPCDTGDGAGLQVVAFQSVVPTAERLSQMFDHFSVSKRTNENRLAALEKECQEAADEIARLEAAQLEI